MCVAFEVEGVLSITVGSDCWLARGGESSGGVKSRASVRVTKQFL